MKQFLISRDVAAALGLPTAAAFLRRRATLEDDHDFPLPMPHSAAPLLWRASEVAGWVERHGLPKVATTAPRAQFEPRLIAKAQTV